MTDGTDAAITRNTRVTLGAVIAAGTLLCTILGVLWGHFTAVATRLDGFRSDLSEIKFSVREIRSKVEDLRLRSEGFVERDELGAWIDVLRARNPGVDVPDIKH